MFRRVRRRTFEWRRVAQFEPVRVEGAPVAQEEATDRPMGTVALEPGLRVALRAIRKTSAVPRPSRSSRSTSRLWAIFRLTWRFGSRRSWTLAARLLTAGFYALEPSSPQSPPAAPSFYLALTQFELRPVEHSSLMLAIRAFLRLPVLGANWCYARAAALYHAFGPTTGPPRDRYAADDHSGS